MRGGAGTGPGRECAALMRDLRAGDSFDIVDALCRNQSAKDIYVYCRSQAGLKERKSTKVIPRVSIEVN